MQEKEANMGFRTGSPNLPLGPLLCHAVEQSLNFLPKVASANVAKDDCSYLITEKDHLNS